MKKILQKLFDFLRIHYFTVVFLLVTLFLSPKEAILWSGFIILFFIFELIMYFINKLFSNKHLAISINASINKDDGTKSEIYRFTSISIKWYQNKNEQLFFLKNNMVKNISEEYGENFKIDKVKYIKD